MDNSRRSNKINLLVVGSSEVRMFVEGRELIGEEYGVKVRVEYQKGCILDASLGQIRRQMKPTTHLIIIWALMPYGWHRTPIRAQGKREITIFRPAIYFSLQPILGLMNQIMRHVLRVNPNCYVYLAIPAVKDLQYIPSIKPELFEPGEMILDTFYVIMLNTIQNRCVSILSAFMTKFRLCGKINIIGREEFSIW
ncbi:UNVERIFIED_CONTAM: hypothetical protein RMT77_007693 [Armadillidium vulgare]